MANGEPVQGTAAVPTQRVKKAARPWSGFFLGLILGLAVALVLQQAGVWPLDQLLLFGSLGVFSLVGILMSGAGRARVGAFSSVLTLLLAVALLAYGAVGLLDVGEKGQLNGGCEVYAESSIDTTTVTDTSRGEPFDIDPDGGISWVATSPGPIQNHTWHIYVEIGGFNIPLRDGSDPNDEASQINEGSEPDLSAYIQTVTNVTGEAIRGTFIVGGDIDGEGGACDGFGFVRLTSDNFFESMVSKIATVMGAIALIWLLTLAFRRYRTAELAPQTATPDAGMAGGPSGEAAAAGAVAGTPAVGDEAKADEGMPTDASGGEPPAPGAGPPGDASEDGGTGREPGGEDMT